MSGNHLGDMLRAGEPAQGDVRAHTARRAALTACAHSTDNHDATELLRALGLLFDPLAKTSNRPPRHGRDDRWH